MSFAKMPSERDPTKNNPLGFLENLLEEEKVSSKWFGSVLFWKHFEYIDVPHIYRPSSLEYRNLKLMFYEAMFYILWLIWLTLFISANAGPPSMNIEAMQNQKRYWSGCIPTGQAKDDSSVPSSAGSGLRCDIDSVVDIESFWNWLEHRFIPLAFSDQDYYARLSDVPTIYALGDKSVPWQPRYVGDTKTVIQLGNIRFRQLRVRKNALGCKIREEFCPPEGDNGKQIHCECYGDFEYHDEENPGTRSVLMFAKRWTPLSIEGFFEHRASKYTQQIGKFGFGVFA